MTTTEQQLRLLATVRDQTRTAAATAEQHLRAMIREHVTTGRASITDVCSWLNVSPQWIHKVLHDRRLL